MITLRPYQEKAIVDISEAFASVNRVLYVLPTGGGKTVTFAYLVWLARRNGRRVYIAAHRIEIIRQISLALDRQGVAHGTVAPGHPMTEDLVQVCMIQTLANRLDRMPAPALMVVDEAHHIVSDTYQKITAAWKDAAHLGVSATPQRLDGRGLGGSFDTMVLGPSAKDLITAGALCDFLYLAPPTELDLSAVHTRGGDYAMDELAAAMEKSQIVGDAVKHYEKYMAGKPCVVFAVNVRHAEAIAERFRRSGWRAASIDGKMTGKDRQAILSDLDAGRLEVMVSVDLVSEGFDVPTIQGVILLRPTKSLGLFLQQVGRALRPKPDGSKAVILDHVGNCIRHGLPDWDRTWTLDAKAKRDPADPISVCKLCFQAFRSPVAWEDYADCTGQLDPETGIREICPYKVPKPQRGGIEEVDGELVDARAAPPKPPPDPSLPPDRASAAGDWADGLNIATASGRDFFRMMDLAGTDLDRLKEIQKARGYKKGWARHKLEERFVLEAEIGGLLDDAFAVQYAQEATLWAITRLDAAPASLKAECRAELNTRKTKAA